MMGSHIQGILDVDASMGWLGESPSAKVARPSGMLVIPSNPANYCLICRRTLFLTELIPVLINAPCLPFWMSFGATGCHWLDHGSHLPISDSNAPSSIHDFDVP
jgi:hypothetical protein